LTVLAITAALLASLTLLPQLLVLIKPYGREPKAKHYEEENDQ
jgi:predicted RND superfamily exporter protein